VFEQVFQSVRQRGIDAATLHESPRFEATQGLLGELVLKHRIPMVLTFRSQAEAGGLMSYSADHVEVFERAGHLAARILKGAKPADLPVEVPTKYQFVLNLKTGKALGLTIPAPVLARATQLIE
jgi:putative tryptophan/tyrosine transport system substrate-binding protein